MRSQFGQVQERASVPLSPDARSLAAAPMLKEIPYDHVATFPLTGQRGNRVQDVINISVEGGFVAVAIGYSFIPATLVLPAPPPPLPTKKLVPGYLFIPIPMLKKSQQYQLAFYRRTACCQATCTCFAVNSTTKSGL